MTRQLKRQKTFQWTRLDNAAKIFPPTSTARDSKVFRFACELNEPVEPAALQRALDQTLVPVPLLPLLPEKGAVLVLS